MEKTTLRTSAFLAISLSTVAVVACLLSVPLMFQYVQRAESASQSELDWCNTRARGMWRDVVALRRLRPEAASALLAERQVRHKRASANALAFASRISKSSSRYRDDPYPFEDQGVLAFQASSCCTCQRGPPGPPGPAGVPGRDGSNGNPGEFGPPGEPVPLDERYLEKFPEQCPCEAAPGPDGESGPQGPQGLPGNPGAPGNSGEPGPQGEPGDAGFPGLNGEPGRPGSSGAPGQIRAGDGGPEGPRGRPGPKGPPGSPGAPGEQGKDGDNGTPGERGDPGFSGQPGNPGNPGSEGEPGDPGPTGGCDHCPPARLAPGY